MGDPIRVCAVDLGSNSTRFAIGDVDGDTVSVHTTGTTITRLAEGVDSRGILLPEPMTRTRNSLIDIRQTARDAGAVFVLLIATSSVRDADNGEAFLGEIEYGFGFRTLLLSGADEAHLAFRGVTSDATLAARIRQSSALLVDIGGGSTEIVLSQDGSVVDHHSFQLGSVRLTERCFGPADPIDDAALSAASALIDTQLRDRFPDPAQVDLGIGVAGTITTISTLALDLPQYSPDDVHLSRLSADQIDRQLARLASMTTAERAALAGMEPKRAPVIPAGALILQRVVAHFSLDSITVSERDILDGALLLAGQIARDEGATELLEPHGKTCC